MFKKEWENAYSSDSFRHKNEYPSEEVVSFLMQNYGDLKDRSNINILDLGCGWGNNLKFFKDKGFSYSGIDFSDSAVKHCRKYHDNIFCCSMDKLPFENQYFDVVIDRMAIQHNKFEIIKSTFNEIFRVLKKSGFLFSILIEKGDYQFGTTYLSKSDISFLTKDFIKKEIDYVKKSYNNQEKVMICNILKAQK